MELRHQLSEQARAAKDSCLEETAALGLFAADWFKRTTKATVAQEGAVSALLDQVASDTEKKT